MRSPQDFSFANGRHFAAPGTYVFVAASEKIIKSPPRKSSPQLRRKSIASPSRRDSGSDNNRSLADRRMSTVRGVRTPECDMGGMTEGSMADMRVGPSRMEGRDDNSGGGMQQPGHDPFSGSNVPMSNLSSSIGYATSFVSQPGLQQTSPQDQSQYMPELGMRNGYYLMNTPSQVPVLRPGNTMPSVPQSSEASVHHTWPMPMYSTYSPGSTPSHSPYGGPRQSGGSPATSVTGGTFQSMQLPPPSPNPNPNHQQAQLGHRPSHHNLGGDGSGGGSGGHQQYDTPVSLNAQMGGGHASALGYTDLLRDEFSHEDANGRPVKLE